MISVSIPQSGFGAFEPALGSIQHLPFLWFQSLSRDSGRLNATQGFEMYHRGIMFQSLSRDSGRLNRSILAAEGDTYVAFQSLSRDSGRLNRPGISPGALGRRCFNPSVGIRGV